MPCIFREKSYLIFNNLQRAIYYAFFDRNYAAQKRSFRFTAGANYFSRRPFQFLRVRLPPAYELQRFSGSIV